MTNDIYCEGLDFVWLTNLIMLLLTLERRWVSLNINLSEHGAVRIVMNDFSAGSRRVSILGTDKTSEPHTIGIVGSSRSPCCRTSSEVSWHESSIHCPRRHKHLEVSVLRGSILARRTRYRSTSLELTADGFLDVLGGAPDLERARLVTAFVDALGAAGVRRPRL